MQLEVFMSAISYFGNSGSKIVAVGGFAEEGDVCRFCFTDDDGNKVAHEGHLDHVMHENCLQKWAETAVFIHGQAPETAIKCFSCQSILDGRGLYSEEELNRLAERFAQRQVRLERIDRALTAYETMGALINTGWGVALILGLVGISGVMEQSLENLIFGSTIALELLMAMLMIVRALAAIYYLPRLQAALQDG